MIIFSTHACRKEQQYILVQPHHISPRRTMKLELTQQPCYHGAITSEDAKLKLHQQPGSCYLVRYSIPKKKHILSVMKKGDDGSELFQNFFIILTTKHHQNCYEMQGSGKEYDDFSELLKHYEKYPISSEMDCIGKPHIASNPSTSPDSNGAFSTPNRRSLSSSQGTLTAHNYAHPRQWINVQSPEHLQSLNSRTTRNACNSSIKTPHDGQSSKIVVPIHSSINSSKTFDCNPPSS